MLYVYLFKDCQGCYRWGNPRSKAKQIEKKSEVATQMNLFILQQAFEGMHAVEGGPDDAVDSKQAIDEEKSRDEHHNSCIKSSWISDAVVDFSMRIAEEGDAVKADSFCLYAELENQEGAANKGEDCLYDLEQMIFRYMFIVTKVPELQGNPSSSCCCAPASLSG